MTWMVAILRKVLVMDFMRAMYHSDGKNIRGNEIKTDMIIEVYLYLVLNLFYFNPSLDQSAYEKQQTYQYNKITTEIGY